MNRQIGLPWLIVLLIITCTQTAQAGKIKCWTNKEGVRECGNIIPQEYSQKSHQEISNQGFTVRHIPGAKSPEEIEEEHRQAALRAEQERKAKERAANDERLLRTFDSADDIIMTRDGKITALNTHIEVTQKRVTYLERHLQGLKDRADKEQELTEQEEKERLEMSARIRKYEVLIAKKRQEQDEVRTTYGAYLQRYQELKGHPSVP